jgi:hypothetical protein
MPEVFSYKSDNALAQNIKVITSFFSAAHLRGNFLSTIVAKIRDWTNCQCVGIRVVSNNGLMPYEAYVGFSYEFWTHENCLSIKEDQCACIRVITGTPDPLDLPILTDSGSIWTNDLQGFGSTIPEECYDRYRGKCIESDFASLAVVPIRHNSIIMGLIHLADPRKDMIPKENILILESVAPDIGEVVLRFSTEDDLSQKKEYS